MSQLQVDLDAPLRGILAQEVRGHAHVDVDARLSLGGQRAREAPCTRPATESTGSKGPGEVGQPLEFNIYIYINIIINRNDTTEKSSTAP